MDPDDLRSFLEESRVDIWSLIETAISVAATDHQDELKIRRDRIVEVLYAPVPVVASSYGSDRGGDDSPSTPPRLTGDYGEDEDAAIKSGDELDEFGGLFDDEETSILKIKQQLDGPDQSEETLVSLLQSLADMEITFPSLKETDIGRHVNLLRKHSSGEVRRLVKLLVRKWKEIVDDWVKTNPKGDPSSSALMDGDSPLQKISHNGLHQVSDFSSSPNLHYGSPGSEKNKLEVERTSKQLLHRESPVSKSTSLPPQRSKEHSKESNIDVEAKLASATKRLQANYKEAENAKKQRTIQVLQEIPKPKSKNFFAKNKGGGSRGRRW